MKKILELGADKIHRVSIDHLINIMWEKGQLRAFNVKANKDKVVKKGDKRIITIATTGSLNPITDPYQNLRYSDLTGEYPSVFLEYVLDSRFYKLNTGEKREKEPDPSTRIHEKYHFTLRKLSRQFRKTKVPIVRNKQGGFRYPMPPDLVVARLDFSYNSKYWPVTGETYTDEHKKGSAKLVVYGKIDPLFEKLVKFARTKY